MTMRYVLNRTASVENWRGSKSQQPKL